MALLGKEPEGTLALLGKEPEGTLAFTLNCLLCWKVQAAFEELRITSNALTKSEHRVNLMRMKVDSMCIMLMVLTLINRTVAGGGRF